jgi:hypothetical protein
MRTLLLAALLLLGGAVPAAAQWGPQGAVRTLVEENDIVVNTDRHYTQGVKTTFLQADDDLPRWIADFADWIPRLGAAKGFTRIGYQLGQSIFTPANTMTPEPQKNDRPYAGWLYTGVILQRRGLMVGGWPVLDNFQLDIGAIGPSSLAEEAQNAVHELRDLEPARGWRHQLHDEPGIALKWERSWIFGPTVHGPRTFDVIPHAGISLGNVETSLRTGVMLRIGVNLPDDFGPRTISSLTSTQGGWSAVREHGRYGFYVFGDLDSSTVLYTAFLDGNTFRSSHRIEKQPFVFETRGGIVLVLNRVELSATYVYRTPQFSGQHEHDGYGSFAAKFKF